jgi:DNA polymerase III subunit gamma/tau
MGQALYRKYRSKSLGEIVGQEHVTTTLRNALQSGRISHAYLLSGPRGVGKTSIARILAHEINGLPYNDEAHLDIIEIDAASNRRIDEIRDLRDRVNTAPAHAKYKVYIIDEVHMLTKEAFNALLKTLEEPPAHVVFILATTEAHKLPETIVSRTQRYSLRPVPEELVTQHLREIADGEKITIDDDALAVVAKHGEGSFRDSISLLDQASSVSEHVTRADVERILGFAPDEYIGQLLDAVIDHNSTGIITTLAELYALGFEPAMIAQQLGAHIRTMILNGQSTDPASSLHLLERLLDVPPARNPRQLLEIVLLQSSLPVRATATPAAGPKPTMGAAAPPAALPVPVTKQGAEPPVTKPEIAPVPAKGKMPAPEARTEAVAAAAQPASASEADGPSEVSPAAAGSMDATELWHQALEAIKKQYNTLYGVARMAHPEFDGQKLTLTFKFAFHQKRVNEAKNRKLLNDVIERLYGQPVEIACIVAEAEPVAAKPDMSAISNIFGGAELLES